ncbi:MAG: 30S ribosome-binding factor RbfA [Polyangiales bacterium]
MAREEGKQRAGRVGERIREELMDLFLKGAVHDPGVADVVISAVRVSDDLSHARIYVRLLGEATPAKQKRALDALERASGFLRREVGRRLAIRTSPELRFHWDDVVDQALRIESLFDEIHRDDERRGGGGKKS